MRVQPVVFGHGFRFEVGQAPTLSNVELALTEAGKAKDDGPAENAWADQAYQRAWPAGSRRGNEPSQPAGRAVHLQCYSDDREASLAILVPV